MRVKRSRQVLNKTDIAVLVIDATCGKSEDDEKLIELFEKKDIKYVVVYNKADLEGHEETVAIMKFMSVPKRVTTLIN